MWYPTPNMSSLFSSKQVQLNVLGLSGVYPRSCPIQRCDTGIPGSYNVRIHTCICRLLLTLLANIHATRATGRLDSVLIPLVFQSDPVPWSLDPRGVTSAALLPSSSLSAVSMLSRELGKLVANAKIPAGFMDKRV